MDLLHDLLVSAALAYEASCVSEVCYGGIHVDSSAKGCVGTVYGGA